MTNKTVSFSEYDRSYGQWCGTARTPRFRSVTGRQPAGKIVVRIVETGRIENLLDAYFFVRQYCNGEIREYHGAGPEKST